MRLWYTWTQSTNCSLKEPRCLLRRKRLFSMKQCKGLRNKSQRIFFFKSWLFIFYFVLAMWCFLVSILLRLFQHMKLHFLKSLLENAPFSYVRSVKYRSKLHPSQENKYRSVENHVSKRRICLRKSGGYQNYLNE